MNSMLYFDQGFPFNGIDSNLDTNSMVYFDGGFPYQFVFTPQTTTTTPVLALLGVG